MFEVMYKKKKKKPLYIVLAKEGYQSAVVLHGERG